MLKYNKSMLVGPGSLFKSFHRYTLVAVKWVIALLRPPFWSWTTGYKITTKENDYEIKTGKCKPADIVMYEASDTATNNILMDQPHAENYYPFCTPNYQVQNFVFLQSDW